MGSPARAGIDPLVPMVGGMVKRFPRTRGDRPQTNGDSIVEHEVPPHARG